MQQDVQLNFLDFVLNHYIVVTVFLVSSYFVVVNTVKMKLSKVGMLSPMQVAEKINREDAMVLDVRSQEDFATGHLPRAVSVIESDILNDNLGYVSRDRDRPVILVDKDGTRTYELGEQLLRIGFKSVYALHGGMYSWAQEGLPSVR